MEMTELPVFTDNEDPVISQQPASSDFDRGPRRLIPVSTIDWQSTQTTHLSPSNGLGFLEDVNQLIVQQTVELADLMANVDSENRYKVKIPRGETLYYATENSTSFQRTCFGSSRALSVRLYDHTQQEALLMNRRLACGSCSFWCYLQLLRLRKFTTNQSALFRTCAEAGTHTANTVVPHIQLEVWVPPGDLIGTVCQNFNFSSSNFTVYDGHENALFHIVGPSSFGCLLGKDQSFQILNAERTTQVGSIVHQWDQIDSAYNLFVQLPGTSRDTKHKALLLSAAFLLDYMYFEYSKRRSYCKCIC